MTLKGFSDYEIKIIDYYLDLFPNNRSPISGNGAKTILKIMDKHNIPLPESYLDLADTTNQIIDLLPKYSILNWDKVNLFLAYQMLNRDELIGWWHENNNGNLRMKNLLEDMQVKSSNNHYQYQQLELNLNVA